MCVFVLALSGSQLATTQIQSDCALIFLLLFPIGIHSLFSVPLLRWKMHYVININIHGSVLRDHSRRFSEDIFFVMDWSTVYKAMLFFPMLFIHQPLNTNFHIQFITTIREGSTNI